MTLGYLVGSSAQQRRRTPARTHMGAECTQCPGTYRETVPAVIASLCPGVRRQCARDRADDGTEHRYLLLQHVRLKATTAISERVPIWGSHENSLVPRKRGTTACGISLRCEYDAFAAARKRRTHVSRRQTLLVQQFFCVVRTS